MKRPWVRLPQAALRANSRIRKDSLVRAQQNLGRGQQEAAGQGGGIQGQGQRNPSQGQDKGGEDFRPTGSGARQGDGDV